MLRRPVVGEVIHFQLHIGEDGNSKAIVARIAELAFLKTRKSLTNKQNKPQTRWILLLVGILFLLRLYLFSKVSSGITTLKNQIEQLN